MVPRDAQVRLKCGLQAPGETRPYGAVHMSSVAGRPDIFMSDGGGRPPRGLI